MKDLKTKRETLLARLSNCSNFLRGSINYVCRNCKRANCICDAQTTKRDYRITYKDKNQKTKIVYIPKHRLPEAKTLLANYSKARKIIAKLAELNLRIFKENG